MEKMTKTFDTKRKKPKDRALVKFLARLAVTPANRVPGYSSVDLINQLPATVTSLAWIGVNSILGAIEKEPKPTCFDRNIKPISSLGQAIVESMEE